MKLALASLLAAAALAACDKGPSAQPSPLPVGATPATGAAPAPAGSAAEVPVVAAAQAIPGTSYGAGIKQVATVSVDEILANPKAYAGKPVRVEGLVTDVCPKRGCWFDIAGSEPGKKLRFKVQDGDMTFPMEAKGGYAVAEGVLAVAELTLEQTKARAEYQAKEYGIPYDPATLTTPGTSIRIDGTGAVLRAQK